MRENVLSNLSQKKAIKPQTPIRGFTAFELKILMQSIHFFALEQISSRIIPYASYAIATYQFMKSSAYRELGSRGSVLAALEIGFTPETSDMPLARDLALYYLAELKRVLAPFPNELSQAKKSINFAISLHRIELERNAKAMTQALPLPTDYNQSEEFNAMELPF